LIDYEIVLGLIYAVGGCVTFGNIAQLCYEDDVDALPSIFLAAVGGILWPGYWLARLGRTLP
jgi:hypothetical protein